MEYLRSRRNFIAFWLFGLFNNYIYVIMLSAAVDIVEKANSWNVMHQTRFHTRRNCTEIGTGGVLLADIGPGLVLKVIAPFFIRRMHFLLKVAVAQVLAMSALIIVALSQSVSWSFFGVVCASLSCGLGDITFLTMTTFFENDAILAWSSGTGAAGIAGALVYAALTCILSPANTLLVNLFVPIALLTTYIFILIKPDSPVFNVYWYSLTCWPGRTQYTRLTQLDAATPLHDSGADSENVELISVDVHGTLVAESSDAEIETSFQASPDCEMKKRIFRFLLPLMFYLAAVYFFEYLINQSLFELIIVDNIFLDHARQYRWFQAVYQFGVFLSRSSLKFFRVKPTWVLAILQAINFVVFLIQVIVQFSPNIWITFALILYEGILGGLSYVNTFNRVLTEITNAHREYSMSIAAFSDALGITVAALLSIPLHNWLCALIAS